jgi:hypothetical protein
MQCPIADFFLTRGGRLLQQQQEMNSARVLSVGAKGPQRMAGHLALEPVCAADLSGFTTRAGVVIGDAKAEPFAIELAWVSDPPLRDLSQKLWNLGTRHAACCVCCTPLGTCMAEPLNAPAATRCAAAQSDGGRPAATYIETKCLRPRPDVQ